MRCGGGVAGRRRRGVVFLRRRRELVVGSALADGTVRQMKAYRWVTISYAKADPTCDRREDHRFRSTATCGARHLACGRLDKQKARRVFTPG